MKSSSPFRILTVIFAVGMMTGYVVYSRQQSRSTAPGSKADIWHAAESFSLDSAPSTNDSLPKEVFASSSKSIAPALKVKPPASQPKETSEARIGTAVTNNSSLNSSTNIPADPKPST